MIFLNADKIIREARGRSKTNNLVEIMAEQTDPWNNLGQWRYDDAKRHRKNIHDKYIEEIMKNFTVKVDLSCFKKYKIGQTVVTTSSSKINNPKLRNKLCVIKEIKDNETSPYSVVFCDPEIQKLQIPNMMWSEKLLVSIEDIPIEFSSEELEDILNG